MMTPEPHKRRTPLSFTPYNWIDKPPHIDELRTQVQLSRMTYKEIAEAAGVSTATVFRLFSGQTRRPHDHTITAIGRVFGWTLTWKK